MADLPPIVLAPLAGGPSTPELAAAVSNAGGLGFVAAGYLSADELAARLAKARSLTDGPLGVNVFVLREEPVDDAAVAAYARELERYGLPLGDPQFDDDELEAKLEVAAGADVVSTTFGLPPRERIAALQAHGAHVWATITSVEEARAAADAGVDRLVVQGAEAGGHSGAWLDGDEAPVPLLRLLADVRAAVDVPLVAAGGIATRAHTVTALENGATAVQAGTAFVLADEAGTSEPYRRALQRGGETAFTRAFTGRRARGIVNEFMRAHPDAPRAYPHINQLTAPLRAAARAAGDDQLINLWAGTNHTHAQARPAAEIVAELRA